MQRKISRYADFPQAKKDDLVAAVSSELLESDLEEEKESSSSMWVVQIDRGGHVNDHTYLLFYEIELLTRQELQLSKASKIVDLRRILVEKITKSEEVLFHWSLLTTCMEPDIADKLIQTPFYHHRVPFH